MPELPEVTTTVDGLKKTVIGKTIADIWSDSPKPIEHHDLIVFKRKLKGSKVLGARRRGKNILVELSNGMVLHVHLKMTGHLLFGSWIQTRENTKHKAQNAKPTTWKATGAGPIRNDPFNAHIRFVVTFSDKTQLALSDTRRFAKVNLFASREDVDKELSNLGPEPLSISEGVFISRVTKKTTRSIKQVLLDQTVLAGIGNIYSDEMLFRAKIHPLSSPTSIPKRKLRLLFVAMQKVLRAGIDFGGDSMSDYRNILGERGRFQEKHLAYRRKGKPCLKRGCKGAIERKMIGGRSAHFCPTHQVLYSLQAVAGSL